MNVAISPSKSVEKFNEDFLEIVFPGWIRSSKESHDFRGFVLDKHTILEHLLDLLIIAYFFGRVNSDKSEIFRNSVLANMDFARKAKVLEELDLIDKDIKGLIFKVNDYRVAQSHIKKDDPLRKPTGDNWNDYQECSTKAHSKIASKIMLTDSELRDKVEKLISRNKL
jgi:hypothetical protein